MRHLFAAAVAALLLLPAYCRAISLEDIAPVLEEAGVTDQIESLIGIDLDTVQTYLDWDKNNLSLSGSMQSSVSLEGSTTSVSARMAKLGMRALRCDMNGALQLPALDAPVTVPGLYLLRYPLEDESWLVLPSRKVRLKLEPERGRALLGQLQEGMGDRKNTVEKKEVLGEETIDGYRCSKVHIVMRLHSGTRTDTLAWLARDLQGFPLRLETTCTTPRGLRGRAVTRFTDIDKAVPAQELFDLPEDYIRCKNIVEFLSGGAIGSRLGKPKGRLRKRR